MASERLNRHSLPLLLAILLLMAACKPTEKNYKAAYQVALDKKAKEKAADEGLGLPQLISDEGPQNAVFAGVEMPVLRIPLSPWPKGETRIFPCNVAVARYLMQANAMSHCERLAEEGYGAYMLTDAKGNIYVCIAGAESGEAAAQKAAEYSGRHPGSTYPGIEEARPLLLEVTAGGR